MLIYQQKWYSVHLQWLFSIGLQSLSHTEDPFSLLMIGQMRVTFMQAARTELFYPPQLSSLKNKVTIVLPAFIIITVLGEKSGLDERTGLSSSWPCSRSGGGA